MPPSRSNSARKPTLSRFRRKNPVCGKKRDGAGPAPSRFFPQTGFFLRNRDNVGFLAEFERLGGIDRIGYPVSRVFQASGFSYQAFQRGILQWRPEVNGATV